jgi:hypothetical protein
VYISEFVSFDEAANVGGIVNERVSVSSGEIVTRNVSRNVPLKERMSV